MRQASRSASGTVAPPGDGLIEVHVRELSQLFDSMDPSPFHEKDLDRNAEEYIVSSARELSGREPTVLVVYLDDPIVSDDAAPIVRTAVRVHFERLALLSRRELRQLLRRGWISLAIGLLVLTAALLGGSLLVRNADSPFIRLVQESLLIGGWVAMWRPMEILLYDWWGVRGMRRVYERLSRLEVQVVPDPPHPSAARRDTADSRAISPVAARP